MSECSTWYEGDPILEAYHKDEWCKINHDDDFQFEMLCLEGASVGLSWKTSADVPTVSDVSERMSKDMKKRGIGFAGPVITYSLLQSIGIVNDHLDDCEDR